MDNKRYFYFGSAYAGPFLLNRSSRTLFLPLHQLCGILALVFDGGILCPPRRLDIPLGFGGKLHL